MTDIVRDSSIYVEQIFNEKLPKGYSFHDSGHTRSVVDGCIEISVHEGLDDEENEILVLAAWFHDTGYIDTYFGHEEKSISIAREFLSKRNYPEDKLARVIKVINATRLSIIPADKLERIIRDADLKHLGSADYDTKCIQLRKEWETVLNKKYSDFEWCQVNINFFKTHNFYTDYARHRYEGQKKLNLENLEEKQKNIIEDKMDNALNPAAEGEKNLKIKNGNEGEKKKAKRGVETVFRITSKNHIELSSIADNKANIMISINAIIISIVVSALMAQLQQMPVLVVPTIILLVVCLSTIISATISTRPKVTTGKVSREDIDKGEGNLLFFGNFHKMTLEEYEWGMKKLLEDKDYLYGSLTRDIYYLGLVLQRKYKFLRISYNIFMYGLVLAVISYVIAFMVSY